MMRQQNTLTHLPDGDRVNGYTGQNHRTIKENNLSFIIRLIHHHTGCSRLDISRRTGLTQASITKIVNRLISWELVEEVQPTTHSRGRSPIGLKLNQERLKTIGIRLNRDYVKAGLYDIDGHQLQRKEITIDFSLGAEQAFSRMTAFVSDFIQENSNDKFLGIGVAVPGPFLVEEEKILLMSGFLGWEKIAIRKEFEEKFKLPVFVAHDAICGAFNECWYQNEDSDANLVFIAVDKGVGAGILVQGIPYHGHLGTAGEFGHMSIHSFGKRCECGNFGCLELYCSAVALLEEYGDTSGNMKIDTLLQRVREGDARALAAYRKIAEYLGIGIVNIVNTLNPKTIVISDRLAIPCEELLASVDAVLKQRLLPTVYENLTILVRPYDDDVMLSGAGALVLENISKWPTRFFKPLEEFHDGEAD